MRFASSTGRTAWRDPWNEWTTACKTMARSDAVAQRPAAARSGCLLQPPGTGWPPPGATLEAHASRGSMPLAKRKRQILFETAIAWVVLKTKIKLGGFDPAHYQRTVGANADYRKFDDGLKMTLDCDAETVVRLKVLLEAAQSAGTVSYGMHIQNEAMMTCIVPSIMDDTHVHFIDGASGGYTQAALGIKAGP